MSARALLRRRARGVALGLLLDRLLGEPPTAAHPVVWFGAAMTRLEHATWADSRTRGAAYAGVGVGLGWTAGSLLRRALDPGERAPVDPVWAAVALAAAGRGLREAGARVERPLTRDDLDAAREGLRALVGRDPTLLDASGVAAAAVESLAENTVDAVVATVLWGLALGAPGALAHRAVNTMDAMVGHRTRRHGRYGTAAARLDDAAAWVPARVTAGLVALVRPRRAAAVLAAVRRDAPAHPSPNSGVAEAAVAGALGVTLGGPLRYPDGDGWREERRPSLGRGPRPVAGDLTRARRVVDHVELALLAALVAAGAPTRPLRPGGPPCP